MKELKPRIHENGMDYVLVGDYYVPDLKLPEERRPIGHWGRLHQLMLYNTGTRLGLIHELRLMQCYLMPDETALRELSEGVIEKLKLLTDAEFAELEFPLD